MRATKPPDKRRARKIGPAALIVLSLGLVVIVVGEGSARGAVRLVEDLVPGVAAVALFTTAIAFVAVRMAGWHEPESEEEFERSCAGAEDLGREGLAVDPDEAEFIALTRSTTRTSKSWCATRSTTCPTCCATRCATWRP